MKESEFHALMARLDPKMAEPLERSRDKIPLLVIVLASTMFVKNKEEDADTKELRRQIVSLDTKGHFDFSEWDVTR